MIIRLMLFGQLAQGTYRKELTKLIKRQFPVLECIALESGSNAIEVALGAFKQLDPSRSRVLIPVYICPSVIRAVKRAGLTPCFTAVSNDLTLIPEDLQRKLNADTLAVIIPHIYGYAAQISECVQLIRQAAPSVFIIDDAAAAFGINVQNRPLGSWGDVGIFSFGPSKQLTATGGGMLLISNTDVLRVVQECVAAIPEPSETETLLKVLRFWRDFICIRYSPALNYWGKKFLKITPRSYRSWNLKKMSNIDAALVLWLLNHKQCIHTRRNQIIEYYIRELSKLPAVSFPQENASTFGVSRFYMRTSGYSVERNQQGEIVRDNPLVAYLRSRGIQAGYGYAVLEDDLGREGEQLRKERHAWFNELVWLPIDHTKDLACYETVINAITSFFNVS